MSCPVCGKPASVQYRPFCSRRCSEIDLGKWISGSYVLPATGAGSDEDDSDDPSPKPDRTH